MADTLSCSSKQYYINLHSTTDISVAGMLWLLIFCDLYEMQRRREARPRRVDTEEKKTSIILSLRVLKLVTFSCYWAANISLSQNWMSILTSTTMMETMIRFTLSNCENCTVPYRRPLFVWCGGTRMRGSSARSEGGTYGTKRRLNCCKPAISCGFIVYQRASIKYCCVLRFGRGLPFSFSCGGTSKLRLSKGLIPLSYDIRRRVHWYLCTNIHCVMPKNKGIFIITMVRTSNIGIPDMLLFEWHRANEIWFKMNVCVGMLQALSHLHDPATISGFCSETGT